MCSRLRPGLRQRPPGRITRAGTVRWLIALVATIAVVGVVAGVGYLAVQRTGSPSPVAHYAPADASAYLELRLDFPGDQHDQLVSFMSHFPGFADPSSFQQKIDDTLNQALTSSGSGLNWTTDVEPWFGGTVALFGNPGAGSTVTGSMTAVFSVKDSTALDTTVRAHQDAGWTGQPYGADQMIWTAPGGTTVLATTGDALIVADNAADVERALDVNAGKQPSLADDDFFLHQLAALHADRLATFYFDTSRATQSVTDQLGSLVPGMTSVSGLLTAPIKLVGELRAEGNHLALNVRSSWPSSPGSVPMPSNRHTALAERMPPDTLVYVEQRDVGQSIKYVLTQLLTAAPLPSGGSASGMSLQAIGELLGTDPQSFLDFVQDVGVSVSDTNGALGVGLVATVDDETVARSRVERLVGAVRSFAAFGGAGITVEDQAHGNATITLIHVSGAVLGGAGMAGMPVAGVPDVTIGVSVADGELFIGSGDFVANALDRGAAEFARRAGGLQGGHRSRAKRHGGLRLRRSQRRSGRPRIADPGRRAPVVRSERPALRGAVQPPVRVQHQRRRRDRSPRLAVGRVTFQHRPQGGISETVAVRIRLSRVGATKQPSYRFVVSDSRNARDGRSLDTLGHYNPRADPIEVNVDEQKARDWLSRGAQPSDTVARLFRRVGVLPAEPTK